MCRRLSFYLLLFSVCMCSCNSGIVDAPETGTDNCVGIVGEINTTGDSRIAVYYAGNLTRATAARFIGNAHLTLENAAGVAVSFQPYDQKYYRPAGTFQAQADQLYALQCRVGTQDFSASVQMPDSFQMEAAFASDTIRLMLNSVGTDAANYLIEVFISANGAKYPLTVFTSDKATDNTLFNELPANSNRVFVRNHSGVFQTIITTDPVNATDKLLIEVKSVGSAYYRYLYDAYVQSTNEKYSIRLPSNLKGGAIGFVGAAFVRKQEFFSEGRN